MKPISKQCTQKILNQMNNAFNKIKDTNAFCFFTKIKYKNIIMPVMITNYYIINHIANIDNINIYINNELNKIKLGKMKYFNKDYDLAIIQIKENKKIIFLELDNYLYLEESELYFNKESIYIINYNNENDISVTYSKINNIKNSKLLFSSFIIKNNNNIPILIFNLSNNKLIGLYKSNSKYKGLLFNIFIKAFVNECKNIKRVEKDYYNEIDILINVNKNDIKNKIYYLNKEFNNTNEFNKLNEKNTLLYINNIRNKYMKYFFPEKQGIYHIKFKFSINLIDCSFMFADCENIININFISFNTKYVKSMKYMFHKCKNLKYINNLLFFDTRNLTDVSDMFSFCENLDKIDLSSFDTNHVKNMSYMFYYCKNLKNLKLFKFNTKNIINMDNMFDNFNKSKANSYNIKINNSFNKYPNQIDILIKVEEYQINRKIYFVKDFQSDYNSINPINERYDKIEKLELYINDIQSEFKPYIIPKKEGEYNIKLIFTVNLADCSEMFSHCISIIKIDFSYFNTLSIRNMQKMFCGCENLKNLDLSSFDTKNVIDMSQMFQDCKKINNLDLSSFNTKNTTKMNHMFCGCENLKNINLSSFNTKNVKDMSYMFQDCKNLDNLDLSSFITKNVTNMRNMFDGCSNLKNLDISSFYISNVTNVKSIFSCCRNIIYETNKSKFKQYQKEELTDWSL